VNVEHRAELVNPAGGTNPFHNAKGSSERPLRLLSRNDQAFERLQQLGRNNKCGLTFKVAADSGELTCH